MDYGTVTERINRGVRVLAEHGVTLNQLDADRFGIERGDDCALGQAYEILYPGDDCPGFYGGYGVLRDQWSDGTEWDAVEWANYHGFSPSRAGGTVYLNAEWRHRIREAQRGL